MSLPRFYLSEQILCAEKASVFELRLDTEDLAHAKVLRLAPDEHIAVIDASTDYFECEIRDFDGKRMVVSIASHSSVLPRPRVTLYQGIAKGDKMETVIRHATELGVHSFVPMACSRCVMKLDAAKEGKKIQRWQAIAKSAAMQSGQPCIPSVSKSVKIAAAVEQLLDYDVVLVAWEEAPQTLSIRTALAAINEAKPLGDINVAIIVGPEGGLSEAEVNDLLARVPAARLVSLGPSILRTETAGIVAPALVLYELGLRGMH